MKFSSRKTRGLSRRRFLSLGLSGLGGLVAADTFWYEPQAVRVERLVQPAGPVGKGIRMVQVSDLHLNSHDHYFQEVAARVNTLKPDLVLLTGDYLEEERNIRGVLDFLRELKASQGIFAVQGNWEYWSRLEGDNLRRHFSGVGVELLIDAGVDREVMGQAVSLFGLDYPSTTDQLRRLQKEVDPQRFNLLLSHVPAFAHEQLNEHIGLVLSGHTHGGQVRLPFLPPLYLPRYSGRFVSGLYRVGPRQTPLYVSRGIGTSVLPMRFLCRPEITLIDLA